MASQEDVDRISAMASETEDVVKLKEYRQELADIAATMQRIFDGSNDPEMREEVAQIKESAEYEAEEISRRARQLEIDQMDPDYERRKAEREAFEAGRKQKEQQDAQAGLKQLSGLLGGLMGGKGGGEEGGGGLGALGGMFGMGGQQAGQGQNDQEAAPAEGAATPAPEVPGGGAREVPAGASTSAAAPVASAPATVTKCRSCGQPIEGSPKFCPNCGTPTQMKCSSCGTPIEGTPKFCPECGTPTGLGG